MCAPGVASFSNGPTTRDWAISAAKYSSTTSGCSLVEIIFLRADLSEDEGLLKPSLKPWDIPEIKKWTKAVLGCSHKLFCHCVRSSGVVMAVASGGTKTVSEIPDKWVVQSLIQVVYDNKLASVPINGGLSSLR